MNIRYWITPLLMLVLLSNITAQEPVFFNVQQFGASGQKEVLATKNIQMAIDKCFQAGGGVVYFPPGDYLSGHIAMKSNVSLHLEAGATVWASHNEKDYETANAVEKSYEGNEMPSGNVPVLFYAHKAKNITITGKGTINGWGQRIQENLKEVDKFTLNETENARKAGVDLKMYYKVAPFTNMVIFDDCENVTVRDISLIESTSWTLHFKWCSKVRVEGINVESSLENGVNSDGIDIDGCNDVLISNCIVHTGDDAIVLKTTRTPGGQTRVCENVMVTNCKLTSTDSGLKLGTESFSDFKHIVFSNCILRNTNRALSIIIRDGATVSDVMYSNISIECNRKYYFWWGNGDPIWLVVRKRNPDSKVGSIKNITFQNIMAHAQGTTKLEGFAGEPLNNITLSDVQIFMEPESTIDKRATDAFLAHDITDLTLRNVKVYWDNKKPEPLWKNAFSFENVKGLHLDQLTGSQSPSNTGALIALNNVSNALIERSIPDRENTIFLSAHGKETNHIILNGNYGDNLREKIIKSPEVDGKSIVIMK